MPSRIRLELVSLRRTGEETSLSRARHAVDVETDGADEEPVNKMHSEPTMRDTRLVCTQLRSGGRLRAFTLGDWA
jgi:hypothetical protein